MAQSWWNNPGNIGFGGFAKGYGASASGTPDSGHLVAAFPDLNTGWQATYDLALSKYNAGKTTLNDLIAGTGGWTPGNYTAASNIGSYMGVSPNADLNLNNPSSMQSFGNALARQEGSTYAIGTAPLPGDTSGGTDSGNGSLSYAPTDAGVASGSDATSLPGPLGDQSAIGSGMTQNIPGGSALPSFANIFGGNTGAGAGAGAGALGGMVSGLWEAVGATAVSTAGSNVAKSTTQAAQTVQSGLTTLGKSVAKTGEQADKTQTANTQSGIKAGGSWLGSLETSAANLLIRGGIILVGVVILAGAWVFYAAEAKHG